MPEISKANIEKAAELALEAVDEASDLKDLTRARVAHLGESSALVSYSAQMKQVPKEFKAALGKVLGKASKDVAAAFEDRREALERIELEERLAAEHLDVTAVSGQLRAGARNPLALLQEFMSDIFVGMGWEVAEGPELEHEWFNFDALNFDEDHPARQMQDTFFVSPPERHLVLRTHTSPVQVRSMLERDLPLYIVCPGRVYRTDEFDSTHLPVFTQFEALAIDKNLTMAHLKGTLDRLAKALFGDEATTRLRTNYFPFTEPSAEFDLWHPTFKEGPRWIEWGGCGMVNANVLRAAGIDPEIYKGFAFGIGIERSLMFRSDIKDMRDMAEGDVRFSEQFGLVV